MATFSILYYDEETDSKRLLFTSDPIDPKLTAEMRGLFEGEPKDGYIMSFKRLTQLIDKIDLINPQDHSVGLALLPGKSAVGDNFNIALEGIRYRRSDPSDPKSPIEISTLLRGDEYFGAISKTDEDFSEIYTKETGRATVRSAITRPDPNTTIILVDKHWLITIKQLMIRSLPIRFLFGRIRDSRRLTMILTGQLRVGRVEETLHLDEHDLIP